MLLHQVFLTEDDIIASVQSTDISPPDFQEKFDDDNANYGEELIPPTSEEAKIAAGTCTLRAYLSCKENVNTAVFCNLLAIDHTLAYTLANSKTQTDVFRLSNGL